MTTADIIERLNQPDYTLDAMRQDIHDLIAHNRILQRRINIAINQLETGADPRTVIQTLETWHNDQQ